MRRADLLAWKKDRGVERGKRQRRMAKKHKDGDHITEPVHPDPGEGSGDGEPAGDPDDSFEALVSAWAASSELRAAWANAPLKARERFMTEVLQMIPLVPLH